MIKYLIVAICFTFSGALIGQDAEKKVRKPLYNTEADAQTQIEEAVKNAKSENKHVFLKIGGNWCKWCYYFHEFVEEDEEIKSLMDTHFVEAKINYSKENMNAEVMEQLGFPQRFGFPVFVILDQNGVRLHTQNSAYLESEESYDKKGVISFLNAWSPGALNPQFYHDR